MTTPLIELNCISAFEKHDFDLLVSLLKNIHEMNDICFDALFTYILLELSPTNISADIILLIIKSFFDNKNFIKFISDKDNSEHLDHKLETDPQLCVILFSAYPYFFEPFISKYLTPRIVQRIMFECGTQSFKQMMNNDGFARIYTQRFFENKDFREFSYYFDESKYACDIILSNEHINDFDTDEFIEQIIRETIVEFDRDVIYEAHSKIVNYYNQCSHKFDE